ncbi:MULTISPECIES: hypothetical protein [Pseudanabaena]|uniref:hypothetical protein n=1 Tax=Pseudanabaena TaxID=1152 RepID=UPI002479B9D9|nr:MULTISPECIES: hypothetical protein [Pseudanabaena]MEA5489496.1 hypothetical protein [Pseudanabaena sp. CCNP1317]WGS74166.1 hypothetical protein OA858_09115 [Pseudanabaena galeata CCNP1313]
MHSVFKQYRLFSFRITSLNFYGHNQLHIQICKVALLSGATLQIWKFILRCGKTSNIAAIIDQINSKIFLESIAKQYFQEISWFGSRCKAL